MEVGKTLDPVVGDGNLATSITYATFWAMTSVFEPHSNRRGRRCGIDCDSSTPPIPLSLLSRPSDPRLQQDPRW